MIQNPINLHDYSSSQTAAALMNFLRRWKWEILDHPPYSPDMSPCDYDLFAKVKEPLRGTLAIRRSIRNINKDGRGDGVRRIPNMWQKVINKGATILKVHKNSTALCQTNLWDKTFSISYVYISHGGRTVIGISGSLIWSKTLMELIFNPCGEFRWSPVGPVSQIHSRHLLVGAPGIFSDILRFVQMLNREWGAVSNGKLPHLFIPSKTAT